jgi:hypothetical protein
MVEVVEAEDKVEVEVEVVAIEAEVVVERTTITETVIEIIIVNNKSQRLKKK